MPTRIKSLPKVLRRWYGKVTFFEAAIASIVIAAVCLLLPSEPTIRGIGLVLQLCGICTVIMEITNTRKLFGCPPLVGTPLSPPVVGRSTTVGMSAYVVGARGFQLCETGKNPTTEDRLDTLERNAILIYNEICAIQKEMHELQGIDTFKQEDQIRQIASNTAKLEEASKDGLNKSLLGVFWLFAGVILSTLAPEIFLYIVKPLL